MYRTRTLIAGLTLAVAVISASAAFAAPGQNGHGATVVDCRALTGGAVTGVAVLTPGVQTYQGDPACIAVVNSGF